MQKISKFKQSRPFLQRKVKTNKSALHFCRNIPVQLWKKHESKSCNWISEVAFKTGISNWWSLGSSNAACSDLIKP